MLGYGEENDGQESRNLGFLGLLYSDNNGRNKFLVCAVFLVNFGVRPGFKYQSWYQLAGWCWIPQSTPLGLSFLRDKMAFWSYVGFIRGSLDVRVCVSTPLIFTAFWNEVVPVVIPTSQGRALRLRDREWEEFSEHRLLQAEAPEMVADGLLLTPSPPCPPLLSERFRSLVKRRPACFTQLPLGN